MNYFAGFTPCDTAPIEGGIGLIILVLGLLISAYWVKILRKDLNATSTITSVSYVVSMLIGLYLLVFGVGGFILDIKVGPGSEKYVLPLLVSVPLFFAWSTIRIHGFSGQLLRNLTLLFTAIIALTMLLVGTYICYYVLTLGC